ncbi:MAG: SAVED domain-containing protein [Bacillota bacterium]
MSEAVVPRWHGDNYQARVFWENALNLLDPTSNVVEVTFEADGPKAFDDVVVKYDPPVARAGPDRIPADYHQVKWHVNYGGRFGFEDLMDPAFIGATQSSILERLLHARQVAHPASQFTLITTYRIKDGDPLAELVSGYDRSLIVEKLFNKTTDRSRMGRVRKAWREHLNLTCDRELKKVITGFRIVEGHRSLDEMRAQINRRAQAVGLLSFSDSISDFRYDELARKLKVRKLNALTRESLMKFCGEEGLLTNARVRDDGFLPIAIRSFLGPASDIVGATQENTLLLTENFNQRYLRKNLAWQSNIRPRIEDFLRNAVRKSSRLRLILDAHASIAFLAGSVLNLKSGVEVELVQKGRVGTRTWRPGDGLSSQGEQFTIAEENSGPRRQIAVLVSISQSVESQAKRYISSHLPNVGKLLSFSIPFGPGQQTILGGTHSSRLAEQVSNSIRAVKAHDPDAMIHIFAACPNSFLFFLGQLSQSIAPCTVYEFDYDRKGSKTYDPSFVLD